MSCDPAETREDVMDYLANVLNETAIDLEYALEADDEVAAVEEVIHALRAEYDYWMRRIKEEDDAK